MQDEWKQSVWLTGRIKEAGRLFRRKSAIGKAPVIALVITLGVILVTCFTVKSGGEKPYLGTLLLGILVLGLGTFLILLFHNLYKAGSSVGKAELNKKNTMFFGRKFFSELIEKAAADEKALSEEKDLAEKNRTCERKAVSEEKAPSEEGFSEKQQKEADCTKAGIADFIRKFDEQMNAEDTESLNEGGMGGELCVFMSKDYLAYECRNFDAYDCLIYRLKDIRSARMMSVPGIQGDGEEQKMYVVDMLDGDGKKIMGISLEGTERYRIFSDMLKRRAPHIKGKI